MGDMKRHFFVVEWKGVKRKIEYIPAKDIADLHLQCSEVFECRVKGRVVLVLTVCATTPGAQPFRTVKWGMTKAQFMRRMNWDGRGSCGVRFVKPSQVKERGK